MAVGPLKNTSARPLCGTGLERLSRSAAWTVIAVADHIQQTQKGRERQGAGIVPAILCFARSRAHCTQVDSRSLLRSRSQP